MQPIEKFLSRLLVWVPSCPRPLAVQSILDSAIDFCRETQVVQTTVGPMSTVAGVNEYEIELPAGTRVRRVMTAWYGTALLSLIPQDDLATPLAFTQSVADVQAPQGVPSAAYVLNGEPQKLVVYPVPDTAVQNAITLRVALEPKPTATQLPDELFFDWVEAIVAGALVRVSTVPDQSFTNPTLAADMHSRYRFFISRARNETPIGRVRGDLRVAPKRFA